MDMEGDKDKRVIQESEIQTRIYKKENGGNLKIIE